jgi:putative membrane protein
MSLNRGERPDAAAPWTRLWPLALGLIVLAGLWGGPLPALARASFSSHMILHLGVMVVAAPLVAAGIARLRPLPADAPLVGLAVAGSLVDLAVVWGWHAPALHEAAGLVPRMFTLQQASFLAAGIAVWLPGLVAPGRAGAAVGTLAMLMSFVHMSMLGVLLTTAPRLIYAPELCLGGFGLGPLDDQRLGGVLMAVFGGLPYLAGGIFFARRLIADPVPDRPSA